MNPWGLWGPGWVAGGSRAPPRRPMHGGYDGNDGNDGDGNGNDDEHPGTEHPTCPRAQG